MTGAAAEPGFNCGATDPVLADVRRERGRQDDKWGVQRHDFPVWLAVLMEKVGELAYHVLQSREAMNDGNYSAVASDLEQARTEAIQVAAVAVAMIEHIDEELA